MAGISNDGAVYVVQRPASGVPAGSPILGGVAHTNDGAVYVTGAPALQQSARAVLFGDSILEAEAKSLTAASMAQSGGVITFAATGIGLGPGMRFRLLDSEIDALNVEQVVATAVSANEITFTSSIANLPATISPASGKTVIRFIDFTKTRDRGPTAWGNALAGAPFDIVSNMAWAGATSFQIVPYRDAWLAPYAPAAVFYMAGINDCTTGSGATYTAAAIHENDVILHEWCRTNGAQLWLFTVLPLNAAHASYTADIRQKILDLNRLRRYYARENPDVILVDAYRVCVDPSSATGDYQSGYTYDGLHPSATGAYYIGKEIARLAALKTNKVDILPVSQADDYGSDATNANLVDNGLLYGTSGAKSGSPAPTGNVADGWTVTNSGCTDVTCSLVAAQSGIGQAQRIVTVADGDGDYAQLALSASIHARVAEGDVIQVGADIACSSASAMKYIRMLVAMAAGGITITPEVMQTIGADYPATLDETTMTLLSPKIRMPASVTSLNVQFRAGSTGAGGCTFDVSRVFIRKVEAD
jgi:lysophospholipase L1-like esterase